MNIRKLLLIVTVAMTSLAGQGQTSLRIAMPWVLSGYRQNGIRSVSYTHLTLPTIEP